MIWDFKCFGQRDAVISDEYGSVSYQELDALQKDFYACVQKRTLLFILAQNNLESLVAYVSCILHHVAVVMLSAKTGEENLKELADKYTPEYMWMHESRRPSGYREKCRRGSYCLWEREEETPVPLYDELALLLPTSGTTGSSKFVRISYENIYANTSSIVRYLALDKEQRTITTLPMNYSFGLSIINTYLAVGAAFVLTEKMVIQPEFWKAAERYRITSLSGVPYTFELLKKIKFGERILPQLKVLTQAGGGMDRDVWDYFSNVVQDRGLHFYVMYGQTEATARMSYLPPPLFAEKRGSIGKAVPGGKLYLMNQAGEVIKEPHVAGQLIYEGKNVSLGYAEHAADLEKGDFNRGVLYTGDLAFFDSDGDFFLTGRKSRFAKIYGIRIDLTRIEKLFEKFHKHKVYCVSDDKYIYCCSEEEIAGETLRMAAEKIQLAAKNLIYVRVPAAECRSENGKISYPKLLRYAAERKMIKRKEESDA